MKLRIRKIDAIIIVLMIVIAGFVFYNYGYIPKRDEEEIPNIQFIKDEKNKILTVDFVSKKVLWEDIEIEGECDTTSFGRYIVIGDQITDCAGTIVIWHKPSGTLLYTFKFKAIEKPPTSIIPGTMRDVSPQDEGVHFNKISNTREWWYFTVVFDDDCDLPGWTATIGFCHLAWGDLKLTFKPDIHVVTLHSPDGKEYGGMINKARGKLLGLIGPPTFEANTPGVDLKYEDSYAIGESPKWHVHAEDKEIDNENEIIIDLDYFAPSSPLWLHSSRKLDQGEGVMANYIFTGCEVTGEVILDGLKFEVKGIGHHEHAWSPGILKIYLKGWDWCHMKLDNGWNIYYSNYYVTKQRLPARTTRINPYASLIITTDQGETITQLGDVDITVKKSDKLFLLLKMPTDMTVSAKTSITQPLLRTYSIHLDIDITAANTYDRTWKIPTYVGMKIGLNTVSGKISWSDDDGIHEVELSGLGTIWNMRKF